MNQELKNIFNIAKKAAFQTYLSYTLILIGLVFAVLGAILNTSFIDKPFYILAIIFVIAGFVLSVIFARNNKKSALKEINNLTILKQEYINVLKGVYLYPLFVWNRMMKITNNVIGTINQEVETMVNEKEIENEDKAVFSTERLILRHLTKEDLETVFKYRNNKEINEYQTYDFLDKANIEKVIENNNHTKLLSENGLFAIALKDKNQIIGELFVSYKEIEKEYYIGFTIDKPFQHQGYAFEIVSELLVQVATKVKGIVFVCTAYEKNKNSISLIQKLEFKKVGQTLGPKGKILIYKKRFS